MKDILIVGGAGNVGHKLIDYLIEDYSITILDLKSKLSMERMAPYENRIKIGKRGGWMDEIREKLGISDPILYEAPCIIALVGDKNPYDFTLDNFSPSYISSLCETFSMGGGR